CRALSRRVDPAAASACPSSSPSASRSRPTGRRAPHHPTTRERQTR
ncbi:MAG: hypothetical protein AVDCRST_MAG32-1174, partial [uncultured Nocardioides sp.]